MRIGDGDREDGAETVRIVRIGQNASRLKVTPQPMSHGINTSKAFIFRSITSLSSIDVEIMVNSPVKPKLARAKKDSNRERA